MTKYLITGGAGLIGSNLAYKLTLDDNKVKIVDNLWRGKIDYLKKNNQYFIDIKKNFYKLDLYNYNNCINVSKNIDVIIHLADVVAGINYVFDNEFDVFQSNLIINSNMLNAAIKNKVQNYLYVGTACSYPAEMQAKLNSQPFVEEDAYPANPESSYGWSKLIGEYQLELAQKENLIQSSILRLHNVYGPPCELSPEKSQVIPSLCRKLILDEEFIVWGSGKQRRAFIYVDDVVDAIMASLEKGFNKGVIQIGPNLSTSISDIAKKLLKISGKTTNIVYDTSKPEGDVDRSANFDKAKKILNWFPKISLDEGLEKTYEWSKKYLNK